tara:strand:- start:3313 stop:6003 length:2691 start_codon:yes stop_codon:yes gene_type:complete
MVLNENNVVDTLGMGGDNIWYHWFAISEKERFLIAIDQDALGIEDLMNIWKLSANGTVSKISENKISIDEPCFHYLTHSVDDSTENLKAVAIGTSLLLLNSEVKAGFTSDGTSTTMFNLDGTPNNTSEDVQGKEEVYETASAVDRRQEAVLWSQFSTYLPGDTVIDTGDIHIEDDSFRGIWQVNLNIHGETVGPENKHPFYKYRNDRDRGVIQDITATPPSFSGLLLYDTYYIKGGGTRHSSWGTFYNEGDASTAITDISDGAQVRCTTVNGASSIWRINKWRNLRDSSDNPRYTEFIPVKDYVYPNPDKAYLGQSVTDLTKLRLPPDSSDVEDRNNAEMMLKNLYPAEGDPVGRGKVYYFSSSYASLVPGYYRVKNTEVQPYFHKIRTPDKMSLIDKNRMPMQLDYDPTSGGWMLRTVGWDTRTGGTEDSNPGPSPFRNPDKTARQAELTAMAFYRDRLWLASGDVLFSSRLGDFDDFWIKDPANIVSTDPIDLSVSSNKYSSINNMVPFNDYLFINTSGDTQFELIGSENQITPFTAEIAPTTFFSTISTLEPQLMGTQIYFFAEGRLYIYFGQSQTNINQAIDVSLHCPGYLPKKPKAITVSPAHNSIYFVDSENPNEIFTYVNRFAGDSVVQNAFFKHVLSHGTNIENLIVFGDYLYITTRDTVQNTVYLQRMRLDTGGETRTSALIDNKFAVGEGVYYPESGNTEYFIPNISLASIDTAVVRTDHEQGGAVYEAEALIVDAEDTDTYAGTKISIHGDVTHLPFEVGSSYTSVIELSEQFVRDERNNVRNGVLNLRSLSLRHANSGAYSVEISRRSRTPEVYDFTPFYVGTTGDEPFPFSNLETDGEFLMRVFGLSSELSIKIQSSYPVPFNITNIEFRGKFSSRDSLLERR